jgi:hypothetical protein
MSSVAAVACPRCQSSLPGALCNTDAPVSCPACESIIMLTVFPAHFKPAGPGAAAEAILEEGVSSCFYHEQKKAVVPCSACGRFLCALCDLDFNGRHLCPACLQTGKKKGQIQELENRRTIYDSAALSTALLPLLFWPVTLFTAPLAIFLAIRSFFRPSSVVPRTRIRAWLALMFGVLEVGGWAVALIVMARGS